MSVDNDRRFSSDAGMIMLPMFPQESRNENFMLNYNYKKNIKAFKRLQYAEFRRRHRSRYWVMGAGANNANDENDENAIGKPRQKD